MDSVRDSIDKAVKKPKSEVNYSKATNHKDKCGNCSHFIQSGRCTLVQGKIHPSYWCKLFERKR
jgi:hypothetical protein